MQVRRDSQRKHPRELLGTLPALFAEAVVAAAAPSLFVLGAMLCFAQVSAQTPAANVAAAAAAAATAASAATAAASVAPDTA